MRDTAVVVPCYNEAERLDSGAFRDFARSNSDVRFLFVNDGSVDRTQDLLEELHRDDPVAFRSHRLERNLGKAEAVRQGMLLAMESSPAYIGYWDADLATPLEAICDFRAVLEGRPMLEAVLGSRVQLLGREISRSPRRHCLGRIFASIASLTLGLRVYDTQCGAKLFRTTATTRMLFQEPFLSTWIFDVEVLARLVRERHLARQSGAERMLFEYPLSRWREVGGSKLKARDFFRVPFELLTIYRRCLAGLRRPGPATPPPHFARRHSQASNTPGPIGKLHD